MAKLISKTYGDALFSLAVEENKNIPETAEEAVKEEKKKSKALASLAFLCISFTPTAGQW